MSTFFRLFPLLLEYTSHDQCGNTLDKFLSVSQTGIEIVSFRTFQGYKRELSNHYPESTLMGIMGDVDTKGAPVLKSLQFRGLSLSHGCVLIATCSTLRGFLPHSWSGTSISTMLEPAVGWQTSTLEKPWFCQWSWCKYFHLGWFHVTRVKTLKTAWGRDVYTLSSWYKLAIAHHWLTPKSRK